MVINEFQTILIGAGASVVAVVWIYNLVQERKHRKAAEAIFQGTQRPAPSEPSTGSDGVFANPAGPGSEPVPIEPPLGDDFEEGIVRRIEPVLKAEPTVAMPQHVDAAPEPTVAEVPLPATMTDQSEPDEALADAVIEVALNVEFAEPVMAGTLWAALIGLPDRARHNIRWVGQVGREWGEVARDDQGRYTRLRPLLQLADRQGPVTELELVGFIQAVERLAASNNGAVQSPPVPDVLAHARALDDFCASVDIQMAVHVVPRNGGDIPGTKLRGVMEANGFALQGDGLFHLCDERGCTQLTVANFGTPFVAEELRTMATPGVTFWLDVPRVAEGGVVYERMLATAKQLAEAVDGQLVDDQRQPLADSMLTGIRSKIAEVQKKMAVSQLPSGGRRALRLFR